MLATCDLFLTCSALTGRAAFLQAGPFSRRLDSGPGAVTAGLLCVCPNRGGRLGVSRPQWSVL